MNNDDDDVCVVEQFFPPRDLHKGKSAKGQDLSFLADLRSKRRRTFPFPLPRLDLQPFPL